MDRDWQQYFEEHIWERGMDYYLADAVLELGCNGEVLRGVVEGSELYHVEIGLGGQNGRMYCDCPYAETGYACKHMAALLIAWTNDHDLDQGQEQPERGSAANLSTAADPLDNLPIKELIWDADMGLVRKYLAEVLTRDEALELRFRSLLRQKQQGVDPKKVRLGLERLLRAYELEEGWISEEDLAELLEELFSIMDHELVSILDEGDPKDAFDLLLYLMDSLAGLDSEVYVFEYLGFPEACVNLLEKIIASAQPALREELFDKLTHLIQDSSSEQVEIFQSAWTNSFQEPGFLEQKLQISREWAYDLLAIQADQPRLGTSPWAAYHLQLLAETGHEVFEMTAFATDFWADPEVRDTLVTYWLQLGDSKQAVAILKDSLVLDSASKERLSSHHARLKTIYQGMGNREAYRKELMVLLLELKPGDRDLILELKAQISQEDWEALREEVFAAVKNNERLAELYHDEDMREHLLKTVLGSSWISLLKRYDRELSLWYPAQIIDRYEQILRVMAKEANKRGQYREIAQLLKHVQSLPGGAVSVQGLVSFFRAAYRTRRAMMEELIGI